MDQKEWTSHIQELRKEVEALPEEDEKKLKQELKQAIVSAVKKRIPGQRFAIFFSGGVDSSLIALLCKKQGADFVCYTVGYQTEGMEPPKDIRWAQKAAEDLGLELVSRTFNLKDAEGIIRKVVKILPRKKVDTQYVTNVGVGAVLVAVHSLAKEKIFFSGLGSEEIFAGYERHLAGEGEKEKHEECWRGLENIYTRDLMRDLPIADALGIRIEMPFLDDSVIKAGMRIHINKKIDRQHKKIILREIAEELGLPEEFAWRKKLGAQYGSKFDRAIKKLALRDGLRYRREYLEKLISG